MTIHPFSDQALLVNFEQEISEHTHNKVISLQNAIFKNEIAGIRYCIPAYCSLTVAFDNTLISFEELKKEIQKLTLVKIKKAKKQVIKKIPVCFDDAFALDMREVELFSSLSKEEIIQIFCEQTYRVYSLGFLPGFPYMGKLPSALECPRKYIPRKRVPRNSVALAGQQAGIYPTASPGGWQIIGRAAIDIFDIQKENPFYFEVADAVQFEAIDKNQFLAIASTESMKSL